MEQLPLVGYIPAPSGAATPDRTHTSVMPLSTSAKRTLLTRRILPPPLAQTNRFRRSRSVGGLRLRLVSAIVARIRALAKKSIPEKTSLQLGDVVADVLMLAQGKLAERRIEVRTELDDDLPQVSGDRVQLQQMLLNLVMNGVEAMSGVQDERRILTIGVQRDELAGRPAIRITVRDLGCGFRPEDSERLFEAFYTTKSHGMGMGLRISLSIVEAHGGRLWATLNVGPGATFSCVLPAESDA